LPLAFSPLALVRGTPSCCCCGCARRSISGSASSPDRIHGLPFVLRVVAPAAAEVASRHDRLVASLGIVGWGRWRLID
jgi:hypothetical protein